MKSRKYPGQGLADGARAASRILSRHKSTGTKHDISVMLNANKISTILDALRSKFSKTDSVGECVDCSCLMAEMERALNVLNERKDK